MAINPSSAFAGKINAPTPQFPWGSARNVTTQNDGTGTPFLDLLINDQFGFFQTLLNEAGLTPSGTPDNVLNSQYLEALNKLFRDSSEILVPTFSALGTGTTISGYVLKTSDIVTLYNNGGLLKTVVNNTTSNTGGASYKILTTAEKDASEYNGTEGYACIEINGSGYWACLVVGDVVVATQFGVTISDSTTELIACINFSKATGYRDVVLDVSTVISSTLPQINSSFRAVKFIGKGDGRVELDVSTAGDDCISYRGGSGALFGVGWENIYIKGATTQSPILVKGFGGLRFKNCKVLSKVAAKLSNDIGVGTFTEFFVFDNCDLSCEQVFTLERGAGNDSFHGCGLENGTIVNQAATSIGGIIQVGDPLDTGRCVLYNAPMNATFFPRVDVPLFEEMNTEDNLVSTQGTISIERFTASNTVLSDCVSHVHCGGVVSFNAFDYGTCKLVSAAYATSSGNYQGMKLGEVYSNTEAVTPASSFEIPISDSGQGTLFYISLSAPNWEYMYLVSYAGRISGGISPSVSTVVSHRSFNVTGWGSPTFTAGDSKISISNPSWTGNVTVRVTALPSALRFAPAF